MGDGPKDVCDALNLGWKLDELLALAENDHMVSRANEGARTVRGLELLDAAIGEVRTSQDIKAAAELVRGLFDERVIILLGAAFRNRPAAFPAKWDALAGDGPRGLRTLVGELKKAVKAESERPDDATRPLSHLLRGLGPELRKLDAPPGYILDPKGIWGDRGKEQIATAPLLIVGRDTDVHTGRVQWRVAWLDRQVWSQACGSKWSEDLRWREASIERRHACDSREILRISAVGAPVSSDNARALIRFLTAFESHNRGRIPEQRVTTHLGWQDADTYIVDPNDARVRVALTDGDAEVVRGWAATAGTWEGWRATIDELVTTHPLAMTAIYASLVPVLLELLGEPGFTIDWSGDSSIGKTTTLRVAASVWGRPGLLAEAGGIIRSWKSAQSGVAISSALAILHSVPAFFDDTQSMTASDAERAVVARTLYDVAAGCENARGKQDGGLRSSRTWHTLLLSTGEAPIGSFSRDTGARARALSFTGSPFTGVDAAHIEALRARLFEHHGHLGPRFVELVLERRESVRARWNELQATYAEGESGVAARSSKYVALLALAAELAHEALDLPGDSGPAMAAALAASRAGGLDSDQPAEALRALHAHALTHLNQLWQPHLNYPGAEHPQRLPPTGAWSGRWDQDPDGKLVRFGLPKQDVVQKLKDWGYHAENVLRSWRDRGWTSCAEDRLDRSWRIAGHQCRMVVVDAVAAVKAIGEPVGTARNQSGNQPEQA